jgi:phosphinothricin acetyltransferase
VKVRDLRPRDWPEVARIYEEGIRTVNATFETEVPSWEAWDAAHLDEHRFAAERDGRVVGWIALAPVSSRCCYAGVAEISAYVGEEARGQGVGSELLTTAIESSERARIWTLQTGVFPENAPSLGSCGGSASAPSAPRSESAGCTASGVTWSCWSDGARW